MMSLEIKKLNVGLFREKQSIPIVLDFDLCCLPGKISGLVGESGCGKSTVALSVLNLLNPDRGFSISGKILWKGRDLLSLSERELRKIRGNQISLVFQEPSAFLNPVLPVGRQIAEPLLIHKGYSMKRALPEVSEFLSQMGIPDAGFRLNQYPFEMSGGQLQRVLIAMALICKPQMLIADEPTTALDATVQSQILQIISDACRANGMSVILISHDLPMVSQVADHIAVMYCGSIVEFGPTASLLASPLHPYTEGLLHSLPGGSGWGVLKTIPGNVPVLENRPSGCPFHPRCLKASSECKNEFPPFEEYRPDHFSSCFHVSIR